MATNGFEQAHMLPWQSLCLVGCSQSMRQGKLWLALYQMPYGGAGAGTGLAVT